MAAACRWLGLAALVVAAACHGCYTSTDAVGLGLGFIGAAAIWMGLAIPRSRWIKKHHPKLGWLALCGLLHALPALWDWQPFGSATFSLGAALMAVASGYLVVGGLGALARRIKRARRGADEAKAVLEAVSPSAAGDAWATAMNEARTAHAVFELSRRARLRQMEPSDAGTTHRITWGARRIFGRERAVSLLLDRLRTGTKRHARRIHRIVGYVGAALLAWHVFEASGYLM